MNRRSAAFLGACSLLAPIVWVTESYAQKYLSIEEAQQLCFPEATRFEPLELSLSENQRDRIELASDVPVKHEHVKMWRVFHLTEDQGFLVFDQVIGKHLLIDYVVAISPERKVKQIEILEYRENYGAEIRDSTWRQNFVGKTSKDSLKLRKDIPNISGATYSSLHVTEGIRRVLAMIDVLYP